MRLVLQRVSRGVVSVAGEVTGEIGLGVVVLVGVERGDGAEQATQAARKLAGLRIFGDDRGHLNLDAATVGGDFLVVSNFTLAGSLERGRRPSFDHAAPPDIAEPVVARLVEELRDLGFSAPTGHFRRTMELELVNDGPATFVLDLKSN